MKTATALSLLCATGVFLVVSGIAPSDRLTWILEVFPVIVSACLWWPRPAADFR